MDGATNPKGTAVNAALRRLLTTLAVTAVVVGLLAAEIALQTLTPLTGIR